MNAREQRDKTLSRVRTTTAVTGIGAVLAGGVLVGWLEHDQQDTSTSTDDSTGSSTEGDGGLTSPSTGVDSGTGDSTQPGVTSGGS